MPKELYKKTITILKAYKYRILLTSLVVFVLGMWPALSHTFPLLENREVFKFTIGIVVAVAMIVSYPMHTRSLEWHGVLCLVILIISDPSTNQDFDSIMGLIMISFFARLTRLIIKSLLREKRISSDLLVGCVAGYMMIAISGFFFFGVLDGMLDFQGFQVASASNTLYGDFHLFSLIYYSFTTLMTIGYGDIIPIAPATQLFSVFYALVGRSYTTFVLAMILKKFDK